jgi:orc1/cdc6 family replication initiation protein
MSIVNPRVLRPSYLPDNIVNREYEQGVIENSITTHRPTNLDIHGQHGTGKSLVVRATLDRIKETVDPFYVPCTKHDTQYKVLQQLHNHRSSEQVTNGYHTAQLQNRCSDLLTKDTVIVLDDADFLLENDGNDLLYFLSRLKDDVRPSVITVSSLNTDLLTELDERTYSSLYPRHIPFASYSQDISSTILSRRIENAFEPRFVAEDAIYALTDVTTNLRLALHWLKVAAHQAGDRITADAILETKHSAVNQYWDVLLQNFTVHHHFLLETITQLTVRGNNSVYSGAVYQRYEELCKSTGKTPVSQRRASDYLRHLELLGIIEAEYYYGGENGKTRKIRLTSY